MHPIERLRHVARASGADPTSLVHEAASALAGFTDDPAGLVTACRRLVDRHPTAAPIWWLAARVLAAGDPRQEAYEAANAVADDTTSRQLAADLPQEASVLVLGWPDQAADALARRADVEVLVVNALGYAHALAERLCSVGVGALPVPESGAGAAAADSDLVVLEAVAMGPTGILATAGSRAAAAVAHHAGVPVWAVAGVGRVLPGRLWDALLSRLDALEQPWDDDVEFVPADLIDLVPGPDALLEFADAVKRADCPITPELLKSV